MQKLLFLVLFIFPFLCFAQTDSTVVLQKSEMKSMKHDEFGETKVFYSQKVINTNTVEVLPKGILEFRVSHAFGDIGGRNGGVKTFFGLDGASDVRIGFQLGLTNKLNLIVARDKGGSVGKLYELGLKYQFLKQQENDPSHPVSLTVFANSVVSSVTAGDSAQEIAFNKFSDRTSEVVQVLIAKKFGKISVQLNPLFLTRGFTVKGDDKNLFAMGAAIRIPLTAKFIFLADYFHTFRSQRSKEVWKNLLVDNPVKFYDAVGVGFEILTAGHVFHINFTNATELLENRFIPHTVTNWGDGQFRWAFTISRNFTVFRDKKK